MILFELINMSDPYTFRAPSIEVAGAATALLSTSFGARSISSDDGSIQPDELSTPVLFGWAEWLESHGITGDWVDSNSEEIADALESFLIGDANSRADVEAMLAELPPEKREKWRAERQERHRSSLNGIGEAAYNLAKSIRGAKGDPEGGAA